MIRFRPPKLRKDFILVAHRDKQDLAAAALSYLFEDGKYLPMFSFGKVDVSANSVIATPDIYAIQRRRAEEFSVLLNNSIISNGGCENLIFLGLSLEQKSYLDFARHYNTLEIDDHDELDMYLGGFSIGKQLPIECSSEQMLLGLQCALKKNQILKIGTYNQDLEEQPSTPSDGIVIVEDYSNSTVVVSVNYGFSIGANIHIVQKLNDEENKDILDLLERWDEGDDDALADIKSRVIHRIVDLDFNQYKFATFFTEGLPYSLCTSNLPVSYVNLEYRPDFFVHNAFVHEETSGIGSAVVFSPVFFKDEETVQLVSLLEFRNYYLRTLIGDTANNYNLKNSIENYPFDLLHICSHGGDVDGERCQVKFKDSNGASHIVEFDHILSVSVTPYEDMHSVESLYYFKSLDGYAWRSAELEAQNYPHELYASIISEISKAFKQKKVNRKGKVMRVANANAIHCTGFNYQAIFDQVGGHKVHPIVFNNTCWSWMNVSTSFLASGARGYIGSLCSVPNLKATRFAKVFYENAFERNVIDAVSIAIEDLKPNSLDPLYIFWGLHFSTLNNHKAVLSNRHEVIRYLVESIATWQIKLEARKGSPELVAGRISDTKWILSDVMIAGSEGHSPSSNARNSREEWSK